MQAADVYTEDLDTFHGKKHPSALLFSLPSSPVPRSPEPGLYGVTNGLQQLPMPQKNLLWTGY